MTPPKTLAEIRAQRPRVTDEAINAQRELIQAEIALHTLRERRGVSQAAVADSLSVSRPRVHAIERSGDDLRLSTIDRYVQALGGRLEVHAVFDDEDIKIGA
jgi:DNA-binding XRE family transcriptional regulator